MNSTFPKSVRLVMGQGGLPRFEIDSPLAQAEIYLHGAHVAAFTPKGEQPVLFMSKRSYFEQGRPIRGGVPLVFPWFGGVVPDAPAHGFARLKNWAAETITEDEEGNVTLVLKLDASQGDAEHFPGDWVLRHRIVIGRELTMALEFTNTGGSPLLFEEAQHTYYAISDIHNVSVHGLEDTEYLTIIEDAPRKRQDDAPIRFTRETDRIYLDTQSPILIKDPGLHRTLRIEKEGSRSTVVWNPWIDKSQAMADFEDNEWPKMLCIETANVRENQIEVAPGEIHRMSTRVTVESHS